MATDTFNRWLQAIQKVGFPIVAAFALAWGGWRIVDRMATAQEKFLDRTTATQDKLAETVGKVADTQQEMAEGQQELQERTQEHSLILRAIQIEMQRNDP